MDVVGILLAGGRGTRFDRTGKRWKLLERAHGGRSPDEPIAAAAARALCAAVDKVIAVVPPGQGPQLGQLRELLSAQGCTVVCLDCLPQSDQGSGADAAVRGRETAGIGDSIACAVRASAGADAWIIALADMAQVQVGTIAAVRAAIEAGAASAAPVYRGRRGHPVGFGAVCGPELAALGGDEGARSVLARHPPLRIEVDDPGVLLDVDTPQDLRG